MIVVEERHLADYLLGGLNYSGTRWDRDPAVPQRALDRHRSMAGRGFFHVPYFLTLDLEVAVERGFQTAFASDAGLARWPEERRAIRLRYEREFLARLIQAPDFQRALEILRFAPADGLDARRERLIALLLERFAPCYPEQAILNPALLRDFPMPEAKDDAAMAIREARWAEEVAGDPAFFRTGVEGFLDALSRGQRWGDLLRAEDFFELEHWDELPTDHLRLGCRQIIESTRRLGEIDPRRVNLADSESETETAFLDETYYPTGGLAGLANRGTTENLVLSELLYMEEEVAPGASLFDLRYLEGELLYYARDSGQLRRKRRTIHFVVDLGDAFHAKSAGHDYQFSVLVLSLFLRLFRDMAKVFERDSVVARFHVLHRGAQPEPLERELNALRALLADEIRLGWVELRVVKELAEADLQDARRKTYCVAATVDRAEEWEAFFAASERGRLPIVGATLRFARDAPTPEEALDESRFEIPLAGVAPDDLAELKNRLVAWLAGRRPARRSLAAAGSIGG
jgi:hypothetical protein